MSTEQKQQIENVFRWLLIGVFAYLYSQGGMEGGGGLWIRRYLAPAVLATGCFLLSWEWRYFVFMPVQMMTLSIGYGGDELWWKIFRRGLWGMLNGASFGGCLIWLSIKNANLWAAFVTHMGFVMIACVSLGVWNPLISARAEEFTIGTALGIITVMSARKKSTV